MAEDDGLVFVIDDVEYQSPEITSLSMAERRVMYDLCGFAQEDMVRDEGEEDDEYDARVRKVTRHPGFLEGLMHIAYARAHPDLKRPRVQAVIDKTNFVDAVQKWGDDNPEAEDDAVPPVLGSTSEPDGSSPRSSDDSNGSSGNGSPKTTDGQAVTPANTGTPVSGTSWPGSQEPTSATLTRAI